MFKRLHLSFMVVALAGLIGSAAIAHADQFDAQINALNQQNASTQSTVSSLQAKANSYQDAINQLQGQVANLQAAISTNESKQISLQNEITAAQLKIAHEKGLLGDVIRSMYVSGQLTTIEQLATSKNLSDYVDQQESQTAIQNKMNDLINQIAAQEVQMQQQKSQLDVVVKSEQQQSAQLANDQTQQQQLLAYNQGQQDAYNQQIQSNQTKIASLKAAQIAANARFIGSAGSGPACGGGYPGKWCEISQDSVFDNWGMYNRECVSYTAFRVAESGRVMPYWGNAGNANQWPGDARAVGIPVDSNPKAGDVAISMRGYYGHAMYVESVNGDGTINISQYNASLNGTYSTRSSLDPSGLYFIHFQ